MALIQSRQIAVRLMSYTAGLFETGTKGLRKRTILSRPLSMCERCNLCVCLISGGFGAVDGVA